MNVKAGKKTIEIWCKRRRRNKITSKKTRHKIWKIFSNNTEKICFVFPSCNGLLLGKMDFLLRGFLFSQNYFVATLFPTTVTNFQLVREFDLFPETLYCTS